MWQNDLRYKHIKRSEWTSNNKRRIHCICGTFTISFRYLISENHFRTRQEIESIFYAHMRAVNKIFSNTNFDGVTGINFAVKKITVFRVLIAIVIQIMILWGFFNILYSFRINILLILIGGVITIFQFFNFRFIRRRTA